NQDHQSLPARQSTHPWRTSSFVRHIDSDFCPFGNPLNESQTAQVGITPHEGRTIPISWSIVWTALKLSLPAPVLAIAVYKYSFDFNKLRQMAAYLLWLISYLAGAISGPIRRVGTALAS
ncbi:MAG: hypothetical protein QF666_09195, partial [Alphaproteobacteria bacterium]|nr:hypothetical protein [Alphaproteobacteria bacterium]